MHALFVHLNPTISALPLQLKNKNFLNKIQNMQQMKMDYQVKATNKNSKGLIREIKVKDLMVEKKKRQLVEVPYTASLLEAMAELAANEVTAMPVVAPPGQWIGSGGSMIVESDKETGRAKKHYIGMVTMLDIVAHIAGNDHMTLEDEDEDDGGMKDLNEKMCAPVSSIIGHCMESLSLWTLNPNTSLLDCMEVLSKGVHRVLVPSGSSSHVEKSSPSDHNESSSSSSLSSGVELVESCSSYEMLTQMDVVRLLMNMKEHNNSELEEIVSVSVEELGAETERVYGITQNTKLTDAIKCLKAAMLQAVPIVSASHHVSQDDHKQLINGRCREVVGTFSATDLRGFQFETLRSWLGNTAFSFTQQNTRRRRRKREVVTCHPDSPLSQVIEKAVTNHVHRVWVVDQQGLLLGIVSLSDIIRVIRTSLLRNNT